MQISRILTISTAHVTKNTLSKLQFGYFNNIGLLVIPKGEYDGYLIHCYTDRNENMIDRFNGGYNFPDDLWDCMLLAYENHCQWLFLDKDGKETNELEIYS